MKQGVLILLLCLFVVLKSQGQENHYWANQFGPTSTFLGGAVTGGVRDNSLIFYNPGAAAFTSEFNLSIQSDAIYNQNIYVKNGAGKGINIHYNSFQSTPQLFAVTYGNKKRPNWRTSIGFLTSTNSDIRLRARKEVVADILKDYAGDEYYISSWNYRSRTREDWYGFALTGKIGEKLGIGVSTFVTFRSYEYTETLDQNILIDDSLSPGNIVSARNVLIANNLDGAAAGLLWKIGLAYEFNDYKLGLTITTPRIQVDFLGSMSLSSSLNNNINIPDTSMALPSYSILYDRAQSIYNSPLIIDFGLMKNFFHTDIYLRLGYFGAVPKYEMVKPKEQGAVSSIISPQDGGVGIPLMAQKQVYNIAVGFNRQLSDKFDIMAGFRTDFNYLDRKALDDGVGFTPEISYWNLFHASAGTNVTILKNNFTVGLTYSFGKKVNDYNFVNLNVPDENTEGVFRDLEQNATAHVDILFLTIGYIFNF